MFPSESGTSAGSSSSPSRLPACVIACNYFRRNSECVWGCLRCHQMQLKMNLTRPRVRIFIIPGKQQRQPFCQETFCMRQPLNSHYISQQLCSLWPGPQLWTCLFTYALHTYMLYIYSCTNMYSWGRGWAQDCPCPPSDVWHLGLLHAYIPFNLN